MDTAEFSLPEDFDFSAAFDKAIKEVLAPLGRIEMLKSRVYLSGKEVAELYGIPEASLRTWRTRGGGPKFYQPYEKGTVLYKHDDIMEFMRKNHMKG